MSNVRERHPHDGYAYAGCSCVCCAAVRSERQQADRADAAERDRDERESRRIDAEYDLVVRLGAMKDDADRLAAAGKRVMDDISGGYEVSIGATGQLVRALRQHEEVT